MNVHVPYGTAREGKGVFQHLVFVGPYWRHDVVLFGRACGRFRVAVVVGSEAETREEISEKENLLVVERMLTVCVRILKDNHTLLIRNAQRTSTFGKNRFFSPRNLDDEHGDGNYENDDGDEENNDNKGNNKIKGSDYGVVTCIDDMKDEKRKRQKKG